MPDGLGFGDLLNIHENRSKLSRRTDEALKADKAPSKEAWASSPGEFDWPGVDTPSSGGRFDQSKDISDTEALEGDRSVFRVEQRGMGFGVENESSLFGETFSGIGSREDAIEAGRRKQQAADDGVLLIEDNEGNLTRRIE